MNPIFVDRQREFSQLNALLQSALAGQGQVAFVLGEAGQGKTAMLQAFARRAQETYADLLVAGGNCNAYTGIGDPYLPFRETLAELVGSNGIQRSGGDGGEGGDRLSQCLPITAQAILEQGADLIDTFIPAQRLLSAASSTSDMVHWQSQLRQQLQHIHNSNPQQQALFEQYTRVLQTLCHHAPLLLWLDDLQWADVGSMGLLFHLGRRLKGHRILILGAYRPSEVALGRDGERHPLEPIVNEFQRNFGNILFDLSQAEGRLFIDELLDSEPNHFDDEFRQTLFHQTEGHPLFTIELMRDMQERGDVIQDDQGAWIAQPDLDWAALPARTEGAIAERINRLAPPLQELLQIASAMGEEFTAEVIARILNLDEREIIRQLSRELDQRHRLVQSLGVYREGELRCSRYRFRHILIQRYVYCNVDTVERVYLHEAIAHALENLYEQHTEPIAIQLARHFKQAEMNPQAVRYLLQAGMRARRLSANEEAIAHFNEALTLLSNLPNSIERLQQELEIRVALGPVLMMSKGQSSLDVMQNYEQARSLCQCLGQCPELFPALWGLWRFHLNLPDLNQSRDLAKQLVESVQTSEDFGLRIEANMALGTTLFYMGEFEPAKAYFEHSRSLYQPQHHALSDFYGGYNPDVYCLSYRPLYLWMLGYPDQALQCDAENLKTAYALDHPYSLAFALSYSMLFHQYRRDVETTHVRTEATIALCTEHGFPFYRAMATIVQGWVLAQQGLSEQGLCNLHQGLAEYSATGASLVKPYFLALLAAAQAKTGQIDAGLQTLNDALPRIERTQECFWEAELYRLKGEMLLTLNDHEGAEATAEECFVLAIAIAQQQSAKLLELRATVSVCKLWQVQGKIEAARSHLSRIYTWFSEGFDMFDLQDARGVLESLGEVLELQPKEVIQSTSSLAPQNLSHQTIAISPLHDCLTQREQEILELIAQGLSNTQISEQLFLSPKTVKNHITRIFSKMQVNTRAEAIVRARETGFGIRTGLQS
ncbi:MAG TPA: LuxR C-terminal-related transcriptional regulator [Crinalium sp.]